MIDITDYIDENKKYYIYGILNMGSYYYDKITEKFGNKIIEGFIETCPRCSEYCGKKVISPDQIDVDNAYIIMASHLHVDEMKQNLRDVGIDDKYFITFDEISSYFHLIDGKILSNPKKKICIWPPIENDNEILLKKISWYMPDRITVTVFCKNDIKNRFKDNVIFANKKDINEIFMETDMIFVWNLSDDCPELGCYIDKLYVVDPNFYSYCEIYNYTLVYYSSFSIEEINEIRKISQENFIKMKKLSETKKSASIFGSGPSISEIIDNNFDGNFNIVCNGVIYSENFMEKLKPNVCAFADTRYLSPTQTGINFFEKLIDKVNKYNMFLIVQEFMIPLILHYYPELKESLIGILDTANDVTFPNEKSLEVKSTNNIVTLFMLPVASSLFNEINIAGCTGRNPDSCDAVQWKYSKTTTHDYSESNEMFPSLNRDFKYMDDVKTHNETIKKIIEYGESIGKKYHNITTSYIPILIKHNKNN